MYVAITRAKERLYLTRSKRRFPYGDKEDNYRTTRSLFVSELEGALELPAQTAYQRYSGDYIPRGYERGLGRGYERGYARTGLSGARGASAGGENDGFRTFGAGSTPPPSGRSLSPSVRFGNAGTTAAPQAPRKDTSGFAVGVRVRHARFGDGVVTAMRGAGGNVIITVNFEKAGNKDLAAALAPLEILKD